jgi:hypothetical protein
LTLLHRILQPATRAWVASKTRELDALPHPSDDPHASAPGADSDRILIFGSGPAVGYGVESHELALPGTLARALSALTRRGVDVDVVASTRQSVGTSIPSIEQLKLWRYEAVVIALGLRDAVEATNERVWRRDLEALVSHVLRNASRDTTVFIAGIQPKRTLARYERILGGIASRQVRALNRVNEEVCAKFERAYYVPLVTEAPLDARDESAAAYRGWGSQLAAAMVEPFEANRLFTGSQQVDVAAEAERQSAVDALGILDTPAEDRFDRIVTMARQLYGTKAAVFSVIDRDREWHKSMSGTDVDEVARSSSFCNVTIRNRGAMVVGDAHEDERFSDNPLVVGDPGIRFYAGFPVESPTGERIGALCVYDPKPRIAADVDESMLRQLALLIQAELRVDAS